MAKDIGGGVLGPLSNSEKTSLNAYINDIKFAGTRTETISLNADLLRLNINIYFDAIYQEPALLSRVESAIDRFLKTLPFNGEILESKIVDAIQAVPGVDDVEVISFEADPGGGFVGMGRAYKSASGYAVIDPLAPLSSTITFIANV